MYSCKAFGQNLAVKIIDKYRLDKPNLVKNLNTEIDLHKRLRHPHVIRLLYISEDKESVYLVMKRAEHGTLADYIRNREKIEEKEAFVYFF